MRSDRAHDLYEIERDQENYTFEPNLVSKTNSRKRVGSSSKNSSKPNTARTSVVRNVMSARVPLLTPTRNAYGMTPKISINLNELNTGRTSSVEEDFKGGQSSS